MMRRLWLCYHICRAAYHLNATFCWTLARCWYIVVAPTAEITALHMVWQSADSVRRDRKRSDL